MSTQAGPSEKVRAAEGAAGLGVLATRILQSLGSSRTRVSGQPPALLLGSRPTPLHPSPRDPPAAFSSLPVLFPF